MIRDLSGLQKSIVLEQQIVYDYLLDCVTTQQPQAVIRKFKTLFVQGKNEQIKLSKALEKTIFSPIAQQQFAQFFNHCFYIVLNYWVANPESLRYVSDLFEIIEEINHSSSYDRRRKQLIKLIKDYQQSKPYFQLKAIIAIINPQKNANVILSSENSFSPNKERLTGGETTGGISRDKECHSTDVNSYLARYTYLYEYIDPQIPKLEQLSKFIKSLQSSRCQDFEIKLSRHIIYRFRLKQVAQIKLLSKGAGKVINKVDNPSLLSEKAFRVALTQYVGKIEDKKTILERSQRFLADTKSRSSYKTFKQDLYQFILKDIKPRNSNHSFDLKLKNKLENIFERSDNKPINNTLILQTCRQLLSFLIIDSDSSENPQQFANLIANLGTAQVMKILVKITLICPESKPFLEKKIFSIISFYQLYNLRDVPWIIKTLEHLLIAFSIYFGNIDVSIAKSAMDRQ
ncbi:hypothetical protein I4641_18125 [Waterburya agarophytonicola K14]|uniref:Uncharacterized protein n=1 Tax=Waterburya agarophytonicola KI4 TaxID=2874699 RepID=A0A964BSX7_9CYAN|nr:hypothetical protein [Waterburya agarophytonicola]MCC0178890.1 hypothetical protein [Waterburya agarophytonicola KI4]